MDYKEAMAYINGTEVFGSRLGLERITRLTELLGRPQDSLRIIHVAGTNGKGSVTAFIRGILSAAGYKTGMFTSPHIERFSERFTIDGAEITDDELVSVCEEVKEKADIMVSEGSGQPTHFEIVMAMALAYFRKTECDFAVLEVGLGGRLDATNVIGTPEVAVITAIYFDHTDILGCTLAEIASEKAGIIKLNGDVVTYAQEPEVMRVLERKCADMGARLNITDIDEYKPYAVSLPGEHQRINAALAAKAAQILGDRGFAVTEAAIITGLANAKWPGRFEVLHSSPPVILDGAHNPHGARALAKTLKACYGNRKVLFIMGVLADKDYSGMVDAVFPQASRFFTIEPESPRALPAEALAEEIRKRGVPAESFKTVAGALGSALSDSCVNEVVCCFGSLYFIGEVRKILKEH